LKKRLEKKLHKKYLRYFVSKIEGIVDDWDFYYDGGVLYRFEAVKYGSIHGYSFNTTEVI
jgi:hypothetical protein